MAVFKFFDEKRIWNNTKPSALPKKETDIVKSISEYFLRVNQTIDKYRQNENLTRNDLPIIFPLNSLQHLYTYPMFKSGEKLPDHWISNWMLFLPCEVDENTNREKKQKYPVYGGTIEVRIGLNFQIIGFISNIRPLLKAIKTEAYVHETEHDDTNLGEKKEYFFIADAPSDKQNYYALFYQENTKLVSHHSMGGIHPVCVYSIVADIGIIKNDNEPELTLFAMVLGKEGDMVPLTNNREWKKEWLYKNMDSVFLTNPERSQKETIMLEKTGVYHVELVIEHIPTGSIRATYKRLIVGGIIESDKKTNLVS